MALVKYVLVHGGLKVGSLLNARIAEVGETVELDEALARDIDPKGFKLMTLEQWEIAKKEAAVQAELDAKRAELGESKPLPPKLSAAIALEKKKLQTAAASKKADKAAAEKSAAHPTK